MLVPLIFAKPPPPLPLPTPLFKWQPGKYTGKYTEVLFWHHFNNNASDFSCGDWVCFI